MENGNTDTPVQTAIKKAIDLLRQGKVTDWVELMSDDIVFEFPFAPAGYPQQIVGRQAMAQHLAGFPKAIQVAEVTEYRIHQTTDSDVAVVEFAITGTIVTSGKPYNQHYICVVETKMGKISRYRDYWNPLVVLGTIEGQG